MEAPLTLSALLLFAEISNVDRYDTTRVGQFCIASVLVSGIREA